MSKQITNTATTRTRSQGQAWSEAEARKGVDFTHAPEPPFIFWSHPSRWKRIGGKLRPLLGKINIEPGVGGVDKNGGTTLAKTIAIEKGRTPIPHDACAHVHGQASYVVGHRVRKGMLYTDPWQTPVQVGATPRIDHDAEGYYAWLDALVEEGYVPAPDPLILEGLEGLEQARFDRLVQQGKTKDAERKQAEINALAEAQGKATPATPAKSKAGAK